VVGEGRRALWISKERLKILELEMVLLSQTKKRREEEGVRLNLDSISPSFPSRTLSSSKIKFGLTWKLDILTPLLLLPVPTTSSSRSSTVAAILLLPVEDEKSPSSSSSPAFVKTGTSDERSSSR